MEEFVEAGADESIAYKNKPHIGTDRLREIVKEYKAENRIPGRRSEIL